MADNPVRTSVSESVHKERSTTTEDRKDDLFAGESDASELQGMNSGYPGTETPVIEGETIETEPESVTALIGPNGSEKSTLLKMLTKQPDAEAGSNLVDGNDIHSLHLKESTSPNSLSMEDLIYHERYPYRGFF